MLDRLFNKTFQENNNEMFNEVVALCIVLHHGNTTSNLANRVLIVHIQILPARSFTKHKHTYISDVIHELNSHDVVHTKIKS